MAKSGKVTVSKKAAKITIKASGILSAIVRVKFGKIDAAIVELIKAVGTKKPKERLAYELIFNALLNAASNLLIEEYNEKWESISNLGTVTKGIKVDVENDLQELGIDIYNDFFTNPKSFPFIQSFRPYYESWVKQRFKLTDEEAFNLGKELPNRFWQELDDEFRENRDKYKSLEDYFKDTPFTQGFVNNQKKREYYNKLATLFDQPVLNDYRIKLSEIYIDPNFEIHPRNWKEQFEDKNQSEFSGESIHDFINNHFFKRKSCFELHAEQANVLLLLGQPGQGKTSFCARIISDFLKEDDGNKDLIFLRLRDLKLPQDFLKRPDDELENHFKQKGISFSLDNTLIILDGLDELYMTSGISNNEINQFFVYLTKIFATKENCLFIVTSRFHYVNLSELGKRDTLILSLGKLNLEQQKQWLNIYRKYYPNCKLDIPQLKDINDERNGQFKSIRELINQPILLSLVAKANFEIGANDNRAKIYNKLFDSLIKRDWSDDGQLDSLENLNLEEFRDYIGSIALHIYQSEHEFISRKELLDLDETQDFINDNLKGVSDNLEDALKEVLISFYFSEIDAERLIDSSLKKNDYAIEFYHKSLQEYLAAEKIWKVIKYKFINTDRRGKYIINKWQDALKEIWKLGSIKSISNEVADYLKEIILIDDKNKEKTELAGRLGYFFSELLENQFFYRHDVEEKLGKPLMKLSTCFYVYWNILYHLPNGEQSVTKDNKEYFIKLVFIHQIIDPRILTLGKLDLSSFNLKGLYLGKSNLERSNLSGTDLIGTWLNGVYAKGANFENARMHGVLLEAANLQEAKFSGALLPNAFMHFSHFEKATFENSNLTGAFLTEAFLTGANLRNANLTRANLERANLEGANLEGANLEGANLEGVNLEGANLEGAKNYTKDQLQKTKSLKNCLGIKADIKAALKEEKSGLFESKDNEEE